MSMLNVDVDVDVDTPPPLQFVQLVFRLPLHCVVACLCSAP